MSYNGFISYSHAADGRLAPAVQRGLQRFAKPWYRRRALRIFRDDTGLSVAPHLWGAISDAMDDAEWFILLTSPEAAQSRWVNREIDHWKETKSVERILPVVTSGEWVWDEATGDFDWDRSTAVPDALRGVFDDEPRHLDLEWAHDETQLDRRHSGFREAIAQLAAPLHGVSKDDLESEDIRRHRNAVRLAWGTGITILVLLVAAIVAGLVAVSNANRAEDRRREADSQRLAAQSEQNADRPDLAFLLAAQAYAIEPTLQAEGAVLTALQVDPDLRRFVRGHDDEVWSVAVVPEHDLIASGTASGQILLTDRDTGETVLEYSAQGVAEDDLAAIVGFHQLDRDTLWAFDSAGRVVTVDLGDPDAVEPELGELGGARGTIQATAVDRTGSSVAAGSVDGTLRTWDLTDLGSPSLEVSLSEVDVYAVAYSPDGSLIAAGTGDGAVTVLETVTGEVLWQAVEALPGSDSSVTGLDFSSDGSRLAGVGASGALQVWEAESGEVVGPEGGQFGPHLGRLTDVSYTGTAFTGEQDSYIATTGEDGQVVYWDPETTAPLSDPNRAHRGAVNQVFFASDGSFVTAGADGVAVYFESDVPRVAVGERVDAGEPVAAVASSPDGTELAVASGPEGNVTIWDLAERAPTDTTIQVGQVVQDLAFHPEGRWLVGALEGGGILLWEVGRGDGDVIDAHSEATINVEFSPDGSHLLSTAPLADEAKLWDFNGKLSLAETIGDAPFARGGAFSADGRSLAFATGPPSDVVVIDLDEDGDVVDRSELTVGDGSLDATWEVAFHPSEPLLAGAGSDREVHIWDLETAEQLGEPLVGHRDGVNDVAFLGNGSRVITSSEDGTVQLWDLDRREPIGSQLQGHGANVYSVVPLGDGTTAVSASADGSLIFWDLEVEDWIAEGCALVDRDLTDNERERFDVRDAPGAC